MNPGEHKRIVSVSRVKLHMISLQSPSLLCVLENIGDSEATHTGEE